MARSTDAERGLQAFAWALAFVGFLSIAYPLADLLLTNLPWEVARVDWRYQFTGRLSQMIITPVLGLVFILGAAFLWRSPFTAWLVSLASFTAMLLLMGLTVLFVMDGGEASALVPQEAQAVFRLGGIRAIAKNVFSIGAFAVIGWAGYQAGAHIRPREDRTKDRDTLYGT